MSFDITSLQERLCQTLCGDVRLRKTPQGFHQIVTPFTFSDGDTFQLYLEETSAGGVRLTDYGHTLMHLSYENEIDKFREGTRGKIFEHLLAESGVRDEGGQLTLDATLDTLGTRILQFGQAITRIYDLTFLNRSRVAGTFYDDLQEMLRRLVGEDRLKENYVIPDQPNADDYPIDYRIEAKGPQLFLFGIASRDKARLATIIIEHWLRHGVDFDSLLIFADQQEIPRADLARLSNAGGEMVASLDAADDLQRKLLRRLAA